MSSQNSTSDFFQSEKRVKELERLSADELGRRLHLAKIDASTDSAKGRAAALEASRIVQAIERKRKAKERANRNSWN